MSAFTLDDPTLGVLGGAQYRTRYTGMDGQFREIKFRFSQSVSNQDFELHFLEFHMDIDGVDEDTD